MTTLFDPAAIYACLAALPVEATVPAACYVLDERDGRAPRWTVVARADIGAGGWRLDLEDPDNGDLFDRVRLVVLTFPSKTLRTPPQPHGLSGAAVLGSRLCDMTQQARYARKGRPE